MDKFVIEGGERLKGTVKISGSKNAVLPVLAATVLKKGVYTIGNVPRLKDVDTMIRLLEILGAKAEWVDPHRLKVDTRKLENHVAPYELVKEMRASVLVLGSLMGGLKKATVSYPGGCAIGERPIDLHLKGLSMLGCEVNIKEGYVDVTAKEMKGARITFETTTVGGTENMLMAAVLARGETIIENAAREPEVVDLAGMLKKMGARIDGDGTEVIRIKGGRSAHSLRLRRNSRQDRDGDVSCRMRHDKREYRDRRVHAGARESGDRQTQGSGHGDQRERNFDKSGHDQEAPPWRWISKPYLIRAFPRTCRPR